jgi:hypothetical protein
MPMPTMPAAVGGDSRYEGTLRHNRACSDEFIVLWSVFRFHRSTSRRGAHAVRVSNKVSAKYLPLYVSKFEFRYNNRHNEDIFGTAVGSC